MSKRSVSLKAGLAPGYFFDVMAGQEPSSDNLIALCDAMGVSVTEILLGEERSSELEQLIRLFPQLGEADREHLVATAKLLAAKRSDRTQ